MKAPLDDHDHPKSRAVLEVLAEYGFNCKLLCLHEFGKEKAHLVKERTKYLKGARQADHELVVSPVGQKILKNIIEPVMKANNDYNSVNNIFSKYASGVSYSIYPLVYYMERISNPFEEGLSVFTLTQDEIVYLSNQLFMSGTYHWWRIPLLYMHSASDSGVNEEYIELIQPAITGEKCFQTMPESSAFF